MPTALPAGFGDTSKSGESSRFYEARGIFDATIYKIESQTATRNNVEEHNLLITFRIDGGEYDGEDTRPQFVGLFSRAIFTLHDILVAIGDLDAYYKRSADGKGGQWVALPEASDLQGKKLRIQLDDAPYQAQDQNTKVGLVNPDGTPQERMGQAITAYYTMDKPAPEYRPRPQKLRLAKVQPSAGGFGGGNAQGFTSGGGFPGQVTDVQQQGGAQGQDVWGSAQQGGTQNW